jgi:hypothetical protein
MSNNVYSTDEISPGKFRPHGRVEYEERGNILWTRAWGPFNVELVDALNTLVKNIFPVMTGKGTWVNICVFEQSALASLEVLDTLGDLVTQLVELQIAPAGVAFVLPPEVEGARLMAPMYAQTIANRGVRFDSFSHSEPAEQWAQSLLNHAGR